MFTSKPTMFTTKTALLAVLLLALTATCVGAAEPVTVVIEGHATPLTGYLRSLSDARFLLQAEDAYYEFTRGQIVSVDDRDAIPASAWGDRRLIRSSHYEVIRPDGDVEAHYLIEFTNQAGATLTSTAWGVAPHEEQVYETTVAHDAWGNELELRVVDADGKRRAVLVFAVPVAPGETCTFALTQVHRGAARQSDGAWSYTFNVDFPEDRYFYRKVALPEGAELLDTYRDCRELEVQGRSLLVSERYYPAGTVDPLTVRYRLR